MKLIREKAIFMILVLIVGFISFSVSLDSVSAENRVCCEKTKDDSDYNGANCIFTTEDNCEGLPWMVQSPLCELTTMCSPGCCVKADECEERVLRRVCTENDGIWKPSMDCAADVVPECQKGCCMLSATNAVFTTQNDCRALVEPYSNLELNDVFDAEIETEEECILEARSQEMGCCKAPGNCVFTTRANCPNGVDFEPDTLCSLRELGCECTEKHHTECREGYEEVYWVDSCGNYENIYGTAYRADGKVVSKEESCNVPTSVETNNAGEGSLTCGNCDYAFSSICTEADNNFLNLVAGRNLDSDLKPKLQAFCTDLKCYNTEESDINPWMNGQTRENGESWCEYEGAVGNGLDLVGSRHLLHECINGKEIVTACQEERKEVCVQGELPEEFDEIGGQTSALCKPNYWQSCLDANSQNDCDLSEYSIDENHLNLCSGECNNYLEGQFRILPSGGTSSEQVCDNCKIRDGMKDDWIECCEKQLCRKEACEADLVKEGCYWDEYFASCLPATPIGNFDPEKEIFGSTVSEICGIADIACSELWEKKGTGSSWKCVENCDCHERVYGTEANNFCRSLGDCGAHYNVVGEGSVIGFNMHDNSPVTRRSRLFGGKDTFGYPSGGFDFEDFSTFENAEEPLKGQILWLYSNIERAATFISPDEVYSEQYNEFARNTLYVVGGGAVVTLLTLNIAAFMGASSVVAAAATLSGNLLAAATAYNLLGAPAVAAQYTAIATQVTEAVPAATAELASGSVWAGVLGWALIAIALFFVINWIIESGHETAHVNYYFNCNPWVPPLNGDDCESCNDFEICDEYKCRSLGANCNFTNKEYAEKETCISLENDLIPPIIKPYLIAPTTEEDITKIPASQGFNGGYKFNTPFASFSEVEIGISTRDEGDDGALVPEPAICKISSKPALSYDEMTYYFNDWGENGAPIIQSDHTILIPYLTEGTELEPGEDNIVLEGGTTNTFYVKCINTNGFANIKDYFIKIPVNDEPDGTAPVIEEYSLIDGAVLPAGTNQTSFTLYTNEKTESDNNLTEVGGCRWSTNWDTSYFEMTNDFICSEERVSNQYYSCTGMLEGLQENSIFYFKCRDVAGNANDASQPLEGFHLYVSDGLEITSYSPLNEEIYANGATLEIQTSGGSNGDGTSTCYYSLTKFFDVNKIQFENTNSDLHTNEFETLSAGQHQYYVWCEDTAGNAATQEITFTLLRDETSPELERIYVDGSSLYIQLSEDAVCEYSIEGPFSFGVEGNSLMQTSSDGLTHFCNLAQNEVYNIVCQDDWENQVSFVVYP